MMFGKRPKYGNTKTIVDGVEFDSKREAQRYQYLKTLEQGGVIKDLTRQVKYELIPKITHQEVVHLKTKDKVIERVDQLPITYTSDFVYVITETGEERVEDVKINKNLLPKEFELKAKLFFWKYGKKIKLVFKPTDPIE